MVAASSWRPVGLPRLRRGLVQASREEAERVTGLARRASFTGFVGHAAEFRVAAERASVLGEVLAEAGLYWVSSAMGRVALDASQDVPAIDLVDCPVRAGLMCFQSPMPAYDTVRVGGLSLRRRDGGFVEYARPVPVDAVVWSLDQGRLRVWPCVRTHRLPHPLFGVRMDLSAFISLICPVPLPLDRFDLLADSGVIAGGGPDAAGVLSLLSSCWVLMATPTVADLRRVDVTYGEAASARSDPDRVVCVVDLRPIRHVAARTDRSGRVLTRRHLVRGHWTHQPYGPGRSLRRLQWIDSYIRGPADAPLDRRERVYAWRRLGPRGSGSVSG